jgi:energy-coupling factor transporter ATP-binding protein EcfA2
MANLYDFKQCLIKLEKKGKQLFGSHFRIHPEDHPLIFKLLVWIVKDKVNAKKQGLYLHKGIMLTGPVGCGKTSFMKLIQFFLPRENRHIIKSCRDVSFEFIQDGYEVISRYSKQSFYYHRPRTYCFDDLGTENSLKYYGNDCNVMAEILLSRYDLFITQRLITHLTTNLNSSEIEQIYGPRVRSRMREMFNLISFSNISGDKRL